MPFFNDQPLFFTADEIEKVPFNLGRLRAQIGMLIGLDVASVWREHFERVNELQKEHRYYLKFLSPGSFDLSFKALKEKTYKDFWIGA